MNSFVAISYGLTALVLLGYAISLWARLRAPLDENSEAGSEEGM